MSLLSVLKDKCQELFSSTHDYQSLSNIDVFVDVEDANKEGSNFMECFHQNVARFVIFIAEVYGENEFREKTIESFQIGKHKLCTITVSLWLSYQSLVNKSYQKP